jgi:chromosomal replication initiator protein
MTNAWSQFLDHLRASPTISRQTYETWIAPLTFLREDGERVDVLAPDAYFAEWIEDNLLDVLERGFSEAVGHPVRFQLSFATPVASARESRKPQKPDLNPNFTFERFVPGKANAEAHTAARSVSERPKSFNPLYIAGGVGLGKTHLVQAIGHHLVVAKPNLFVRYISGERYVNDLLAALRVASKSSAALDDFRTQFRRDCDVLLIDDIQFIAGKERSQEEFFHTFNDLYNAGKQIVMCGNQLPADIPELPEKLRSRLQWNLVVEIKPPELPLRVAILHDKARRMGLTLGDDVALRLAEAVSESVRQLESALANLQFRCTLASAPPSVELVDLVLGELLRVAEKPSITADMIQQAVARHYGMRPHQLKGASRDRATVRARQMALYLCRKHTDLSAPALASVFGVGSHATVLNAEQKIERELKVDANLRKEHEQVLGVIEQIRREI